MLSNIHKYSAVQVNSIWSHQVLRHTDEDWSYSRVSNGGLKVDPALGCDVTLLTLTLPFCRSAISCVCQLQQAEALFAFLQLLLELAFFLVKTDTYMYQLTDI